MKKKHRGTKGNDDPSELMRQQSHRSHKSYPRQHFFTTRPQAAGFSCTAPGRGNQAGVGVERGKNAPYSHTWPRLSPILVLIQHEVENCFTAAHQICDPNQPGWSENSMCKHANTHAHVSTHIFQTIWLRMPHKLYVYCETIWIRKLGLLPPPFIYLVHH